MRPRLKPSPEQKVVLPLLLFWLVVTTIEVSPVNPPFWASGIFYGIWFVIVLWGLLIMSMTPSGIVIIIGNKLFGRRGMIVCGFVSLWIFDTLTRKYYPSLPLSPGYVLSMLYVFLTLKKLGRF